MAATTYAAPRVVHAIPGRVRIHVPAWVDGAASRLDQRRRDLGRLAGVRRVSLCALTGNVLLHFDPDATAPARLLGAIGRLLVAQAALAAPAARAAVGDLPRERRIVRGRIARELAALGRALLSMMTTLQPARLALHALLGRRVGTLVLHLPAILGVVRAFAASSGPIALAVTGLEAVQLMGEIGGALRAA